MHLNDPTWHKLKSGIFLQVINKQCRTVFVPDVFDPAYIHPTDEIILLEIEKIMGYPVEFIGVWYHNPKLQGKIATIRKKVFSSTLT